MAADDNSTLIEYLSEEGCSWKEIELVLEQLNELDSRKVRESVFDSIESGSFDLKAIIQEAKNEA